MALAEKRANTGLEPTAFSNQLLVAVVSRRGSGRVRYVVNHLNEESEDCRWRKLEEEFRKTERQNTSTVQ